ncbi:class I SAM-dependent methyltransferase [Streptomyces sp. NPDC048172]|uniref:class I SAM-dependent methyltransferase n=1 Tax=Streptomyces sp. NPDC048172 TaxID=3365505 RepID=UPI00371458DC
MINSYAGLARHYDAIMTSGYYDYGRYARGLLGLLEGRRDLLELGVGTGLAAQALLEAGGPRLRITGIDLTGSMLAQARERLGGRARLLLRDVVRLDFSAAFDAAFSLGGIWAFLREEGEESGLTLSSHLVEERDNVRALRNVHAALRPGGRLLIAVQPPHTDAERPLPGGLVYSQQVHAAEADLLAKDYYVKDESGTVLAHQRCWFRTFDAERSEELFRRGGFVSPDASCARATPGVLRGRRVTAWTA